MGLKSDLMNKNLNAQWLQTNACTAQKSAAATAPASIHAFLNRKGTVVHGIFDMN